MGKKIFEVTRAWLVVAAFVSTVVGLLLLVGSAALTSFWLTDPNDSWGIFLSQVLISVGAALVPIGIALFVTDVLLKPAFSRDLLDLARLQHRISDIGLLDVVLSSRLNWPDHMHAATSMKLVLLQPESWLQMNLTVLRDCFRRDCQITLYLAEPDSSAADEMAKVAGADASSYSRQISTFTDQVTSAWHQESKPHKKASVEVLYLTNPVSAPLYKFDRRNFIGFLAGTRPLVPEFLHIELQRDTQSDVGQYVRNAWADVERSIADGPAWTSTEPDRSSSGVRARLPTKDSKGS